MRQALALNHEQNFLTISKEREIILFRQIGRGFIHQHAVLEKSLHLLIGPVLILW